VNLNLLYKLDLNGPNRKPTKALINSKTILKFQEKIYLNMAACMSHKVTH